VPTCGVAEIEFEVDYWREAAAENARMAEFDFPKKR
jgi:phosphohistidine phosphatase